MDCEPSVINITSNQQPSLNINQQRYLQHMHNSRSGRYNVMAPTMLGGGYMSQQKYAPASLPLDLITVAAAANNGNSGSNSIMVLPSSTTSTQDHLTSSTSLIINHPAASATVVGGYAPFTHESTSIHHQNLPKVVGTGSSRNNSNTNNNNATSNDDSMVGVCVQQSPVVIH